MHVAPDIVARFKRDLDALCAEGARLGVAVSGGPDSLALLLVAASTRPGLIEAATVDHALRPESRAEADMVARKCAELGVRHRVLTARWSEAPKTALQERARRERYELLGLWAAERGLVAILTAHHLDDQAETFLMRLARGAGVRGLAGMRPVSTIPGGMLPLLRPLLSWRRAELEQICKEAGLSPATDASNSDTQFERVRMRGALADADWLDPTAIGASAAHLAATEDALEWAVAREWNDRVSVGAAEIAYRPMDAPDEIRRRIVARIIRELATEGDGSEYRGAELGGLLVTLTAGGQSTLRGVLCRGGEDWTFIPAPHRTRRGNHCC